MDRTEVRSQKSERSESAAVNASIRCCVRFGVLLKSKNMKSKASIREKSKPDVQPVNLDFTVIDVETANFDRASICQIGLVRYRAGACVQEWKTYVDPQDYFDGRNIEVHGIRASDVDGAPTFPEIIEPLREWLEGFAVISHTAFDRTAIHGAARKHGVDTPACRWLDSACVARRAWGRDRVPGYGLHDLCGSLGYAFRHHDALEDAKAAAHVFLAAVACTGLDVEGWFQRVRKPVRVCECG